MISFMGSLLLRFFRGGNAELTKRVLIFLILILLWPLVQHLTLAFGASSGYVDPGVLVLVLISLISYLLLLALGLWLLKGFIIYLDLPRIGVLVLKFKELDVWLQLGFYFACFALLLLAGVGCLAAVL
jgi:hypothetical protein